MKPSTSTSTKINNPVKVEQGVGNASLKDYIQMASNHLENAQHHEY